MSLSLQTNCSTPHNYETTAGSSTPPRAARLGASCVWSIRGYSGLYKCGDLQDILHLMSFGSLVCY